MGGKDQKKRKGDEKGKASKSRSSRSRGTYTPIGTTTGAGTIEDPSIIWYIGRPRGELGRMYEQMIRDAAAATGLCVWYIRGLAHGTTSLGGALVRDDPHITVLYDADQTNYPYYLGDEYYDYYDNAAYEEEMPQAETGKGASQSKAKRKRRPKKGKGKEKEK